MQVKILFFATLRDLAGVRDLTLHFSREKITVAELRRDLSERYPNMAENVKAASVAVNEEFSFDAEQIKDGDEVALFPPVSGGSHEKPEHFSLPMQPIDHDDMIASITTTATGAVCLFSGMVRGETHREGHLPQTQYLEYEAYKPMALAKMKQVAAEIRERWPLVEGIAIAQRLGKLEVGQNTVLIACSSPHRDDGCFEAARYGIDRLKQIVPVWKKEVGSDGATWIEGDYTPDEADRSVDIRVDTEETGT